MIGKNIELVIEPVEPQEIVASQLMTAPDGYFESIRVFDVLEIDSTEDLLQKITSKIKQGGTLTIEGFDGLAFCKRVIQEGGDELYGKRVVFQNFYSIGALKNNFQDSGQWKIIFASVNSGRYNIKVERS